MKIVAADVICRTVGEMIEIMVVAEVTDTVEDTTKRIFGV